MTHEEARDLIPAYALNSLAPFERLEVGEHLGTCDRCARQLREYLETAGFLGLVVEPVIPSKDLRDRLLSEIRPSGPSRPPARRVQRMRRGAAVFAVLVIVVVVALTLLLPRQQEQRAQLSPEVAQILGSASLANAPLVPTDHMPGAAGQVFIAAEGPEGPEGAEGTRAVVVMSGLEDPGRLTYMLWVVVGSRTGPLGSFAADSRGVAVVLITGISQQMDGLIVTLEDSPDVKAPTGPVVLRSQGL